MDLLLVLGLIFVTGFPVLILLRRIGVPAIPGLILSGLIIKQFIELVNLTEILVLGISFLVFYIGLRTDLDGFRKVSSDSLNISMIQVTITFALAFAAANYLQFEMLKSLYIALAASLASTLAGTDIFDKNLRMDLHHGQISTAANFIQDVIAVILISGLAIGLTTEGLTASITAGLLILLAFVFRELFSKKIHSMLATEELKTVFLVATYAASLAAATVIGVSIITAAFAAGLAFSRGSETAELLDVLEPLKDFFAVILFVGLGALITLPSTEVITISGIIIATVLILRPFIISLVMIINGHGARKAFKTSSRMLQVSEFSLAAVIIIWATGAGSDSLIEALVISTAVTMAFSTFVVRHTDRLYEKLGDPLLKIADFLKYSPTHSELENHVVVVGFDIRGQKVVEQLQEKGRDCLVIDYNAENIERAKIEGVEHVFGDVLDENTLKTANLDKAESIILTFGHKPLIDKIASIPDIKKLVIVESRKEAEKIKTDNIEILIESGLTEKALEQKISELIRLKQ